MNPSACLVVFAAIYIGAALLSIARLFNWQLWVWLAEMTAIVWLLGRPEAPPDALLFVFLWSGLVFFCVGLTLVLRRAMDESVALALALVLTATQLFLIADAIAWLAILCGGGGHGCPCELAGPLGG